MNFHSTLTVDNVLTLPDRVLLAPMQGVMSPYFTAAAASLGIARTRITPFLSIGENSVPSKRALRRNLAVWGGHESGPLLVQLLGRHAESMAETAYRLAETGYPYINVNFGCPSRSVVRSGHGGACLKEPDLIDRILREILRVCGDKISLSVKMRTGWNSHRESEVLAKTVRDAGVKFVILHFRTVAENYSPVADPLPRIAAFRLFAPDLVLFGNGDVDSFESARRMAAETDCDGVAVARAVPANPFLLKKITAGEHTPGTDAERYEFLRRIFRNAENAFRWKHNGFLECVRMCFGKESEEFAAFRTMTREQAQAALFPHS